jgi:hypothetical protein
VADNSALRRQWDRSRHDRGRAALFKTLVRACLVIVDQELLDHRLQVAGAEDQLVVDWTCQFPGIRLKLLVPPLGTGFRLAGSAAGQTSLTLATAC